MGLQGRGKNSKPLVPYYGKHRERFSIQKVGYCIENTSHPTGYRKKSGCHHPTKYGHSQAYRLQPSGSCLSTPREASQLRHLG